MRKIAAKLLPQQDKILAWVKPRIETTLLWWQKLAQREKYTVLIGSCLTTILLLYVVLWSPLMVHLSVLREQLDLEKNAAASLLASERQILLQGEKAKKIHPSNLTTLIHSFQEKIKQSDLANSLKELSVLTPDKIHCRFENVAFDALITWLLTFSQQENLSVEKVSLQRVNNHGLVQAEFVLQTR